MRNLTKMGKLLADDNSKHGTQKGNIYYFMLAIVGSDITSVRAFSVICVTLHSLPITFLIQLLFFFMLHRLKNDNFKVFLKKLVISQVVKYFMPVHGHQIYRCSHNHHWILSYVSWVQMDFLRYKEISCNTPNEK